MKIIPTTGIVGMAALREAVATDYRQIIDLVRGALDARLNAGVAPGTGEWIDIEAVYPDRVVICREGKNLSFPYTLADGNVVTLGDPVEVMETYVPVREAKGDTALIEATESGVFVIRVIRAGLSGNRNYYPDATLREAVPLFNGVRVFEKSDAQHLKGEGKAFAQLIGGLSNAQFVEGATPDTGEIHADLTLLQPDGDTATKLREALGRHLTGLFGFSVDALGKTKNEIRNGQRVRVAQSFSSIKSVDLIVEPGAGGELIRLVEAVDPQYQEQHIMNREQLLALLKTKAPKAHAKLRADATDDEVLGAFREALGDPADDTDTTTATAILREAQDTVRMITVRAQALASIAASKLPQPAKDKLSQRFATEERFTEAQVADAIKEEQAYLARFVESGKVSMAGLDIVVEDRSVKIADMLDAFFDPKHKDHKQVGSFKEAYVEITGDKNVTGQLRDCNLSRLTESIGAFREALDTSSFANALGNSITRQMQARFTGLAKLQTWRRFCRVGRVSDFRTQERIRIGGYGNLPTVAESGAYNALTSPSDTKATYAAAKRGGTESVTREMILADDVNAIRQIPDELGLAAANTLYEFVFDFFRTNPAIYDGVALFHASHGNLFTGALSAAEFKAHRLAMKKQVRAGSGKRLGLTPAIVLVPDDLEDTAYDLFIRSTNNDKTFIQNVNPEVISVNYWTDANDWSTVCDPDTMQPIEISFINGQEDPELFVQDMPNVGSLFSNDKVTYKIRHEYGGAFLVDGEKAVTKAVVP